MDRSSETTLATHKDRYSGKNKSEDIVISFCNKLVRLPDANIFALSGKYTYYYYY